MGRAGILVAALVAALATRADAQTVVPPLPLDGPYPVACTNVEQDLSRLAPGESASMYWRGLATADRERYVTELLVAPGEAFATTFTLPQDADLYDRWAGQPATYASIACYPTTTANTRPDYLLPDGVVVPRMQRAGEAPILPAAPARLPVLLYSHGYAGSPLDGTYRTSMLALASWGFVVVAPFHGDLRYSVFGPETFLSTLYLYVPIWSEFVAMQATRPLSASRALDALIAHPHWNARVDPARVGAFGVSQGGETVLLLAGAQLTYDIVALRAKRVTADARVRAAVGYVPYAGLDDLPAFGGGQQGAAGLAMPFLALSGTADRVAPHGVVRQAIDRMTGVRGHVLLAGMGHELDPSSAADIATWSYAFLAAWVLDDPNAKARLRQAQAVDGGLEDAKALYVDPSGSGGGDGGVVVDTVEYHHPGLDHYFITAFPHEIAALDAGTEVQGWTRTGYAFRTWQAGSGPGADACRFYGTPGVGPSSHFYSISTLECEKVKTMPEWTFEALAFRAVEPLSSGCGAGFVPVWRLYNDGMGGEANHRYLVDRTELERMVAIGWILEGVVFCTPP